MTEKSNPELGDLYTAKIFAILYESWPVKQGLTAAVVTGIEYDTDNLFEADAPRQPREWDVCNGLFNWLKEEGYIRTDGFQGNAWTLGRTELSQKAIEALKKMPDPINPDKGRSMGDAIVAAVKHGGEQAVNQVIKLSMTALYHHISTQV